MYSDDLLETVNSRYGQVTFFANDTGAITDSLRKYGEWAENELSFMLSMVREGDTIIDVGAYIGTHALAFARHLGEAGLVVSIEAQTSSFEVLSRNIAANGLKQVRLEHAVASATAKNELIPAVMAARPFAKCWSPACVRAPTKATPREREGWQYGRSLSTTSRFPHAR
jgi:radical SAM superfamily enzyme with C-terminal helix-hairpin-helix motif